MKERSFNSFRLICHYDTIVNKIIRFYDIERCKYEFENWNDETHLICFEKSILETEKELNIKIDRESLEKFV